MARLLSGREIDALLEVEGESQSLAEFALAYKDEIALHRRVYELFGADGVSFIPPYTYTIEGYPRQKLKKLLLSIKSQIVLNIIYGDMIRCAKTQYEELTMKREDTYIQHIFDYDYDAWQSERDVAAQFNNMGKESRFASSYLYAMHLSKKHYEGDTELLAELRDIESRVIAPMQKVCDDNYPLESLRAKIERIRNGISGYFQQKRLNKIYADLQTCETLELCPPKELIGKIGFLAQMVRRDGLQTVKEQHLGHEKFALFANLYDAIIDDEFESTFKRIKESYMEDMTQKLEFIATEFTNYEDISPDGLNQDAKNINKKLLQEYTMDELVQKREFYLGIYHTHGSVIVAERYLHDEHNSFIHAVLDAIVSGEDRESIEAYAKREAKYLLANYESIFDILETGLGGIKDGENPRTLHRNLMSFLPQSERWEFEYVRGEIDGSRR